MKFNHNGQPVIEETIGFPGANFTVARELSAAAKAASVVPDINMANMPKIPFLDGLMVRKYFMSVAAQWRTEVMVFIALSEENTMIIVSPATYYGTGGTVKYSLLYTHYCTKCSIGVYGSNWTVCPICGATDAQFKELKVVGTIHSHVDMAPFHSSTDDSDELDFTGIHLTIGHCNTGLLASEKSVVDATLTQKAITGRGKRYKLRDNDVFSDPLTEAHYAKITGWLRHVKHNNNNTGLTHKIAIANSEIYLGTKENCEEYARVAGLDPVATISTYSTYGGGLIQFGGGAPYGKSNRTLNNNSSWGYEDHSYGEYMGWPDPGESRKNKKGRNRDNKTRTADTDSTFSYHEGKSGCYITKSPTKGKYNGRVWVECPDNKTGKVKKLEYTLPFNKANLSPAEVLVIGDVASDIIRQKLYDAERGLDKNSGLYKDIEELKEVVQSIDNFIQTELKEISAESVELAKEKSNAVDHALDIMGELEALDLILPIATFLFSVAEQFALVEDPDARPYSYTGDLLMEALNQVEANNALKLNL